MLYNYSESSENLFYFPFFSFNDSINLQKQIVEQFMFLTKFNVAPSLSGYIKHNNEYYFFLDITTISDKDKRDNNYVWCLIDEIVNTRKIYNIPIHHSISSIFNENTELIFLYDNNKYPYEIPSVGYTGDDYNMSSFNSVFGQRKSQTSIKFLDDPSNIGTSSASISTNKLSIPFPYSAAIKCSIVETDTPYSFEIFVQYDALETLKTLG